MATKTITLKALVDKEKDEIIYVEAEGDFVDVLCSFLTMPLGTITRLTRKHPPICELGCIDNLYASVENLDARYLRTEACKTMLLYPQNAAADHCKNLKLQIDDTDSVRYFLCEDYNCRHKLLCRYKNASCLCGRRMNRWKKLYGTAVSNATASQSGFVTKLAQFVITDELEVQVSSSVLLFSLLAKHGVHDCSSLEERTFKIGADEVLKLLKASWVSSTPLTDVLLQKTTIPQVTYLSSYTSKRIGETGLVKSKAVGVQNGSKISVKLLISKSKRILCYAEGGEDFVNLLFSFLTVPVGHVFKCPQGACLQGSLQNLYKSVQDLDAEKSLISEVKKDILCKPKLAVWFGYSDSLLGLEETGNRNLKYLTTDDWSVLSFLRFFREMDPKVPNAEATKSEKGFVRRPTMFTVTDDLRVSPISQTSGLSILKRLGVQYTDIEEHTVLVGKEEALDILVAAFNGSSYPLSQAFLLKGKDGSTKGSPYFS